MTKRHSGLSYSALGISRDRYWELIYWARQFKTLPASDKRIINKAFSAAGEYAGVYKRHIMDGVPYKSLDIPYSESQFRRIKKVIVRFLHEEHRREK